MYVSELWRYPVKSLRGEPLADARIGEDGILGDRIVQVRGPRGIITSRTRPRLLGIPAKLGEDGEPLVDGLPWDGPRAGELIRAAAGPEAVLQRGTDAGRFDVMPLLVATDGTIEAFGRDGRRLRPNIVLGGVSGLAEREWPGRRVRIGDLVIVLDSLRERCVMTTFDPDTQQQDVEVLRDINRRFDGRLALNAWVESPGSIAAGDAAELLP